MHSVWSLPVRCWPSSPCPALPGPIAAPATEDCGGSNLDDWSADLKAVLVPLGVGLLVREARPAWADRVGEPLIRGRVPRCCWPPCLSSGPNGSNSGRSGYPPGSGSRDSRRRLWRPDTGWADRMSVTAPL